MINSKANMRPDFLELESSFSNLFIKTGMLKVREISNVSDDEDEFLNV